MDPEDDANEPRPRPASILFPDAVRLSQPGFAAIGGGTCPLSGGFSASVLMVDVDVEEGILFAGGSADQSIDFRPPGPGDLPRFKVSTPAPNPNAPAIDLEMLDFLPCRDGSFGTSPGAGEGDLLLPILRENEKLLRREDCPSACCDDCERSDGFGETDR